MNQKLIRLKPIAWLLGKLRPYDYTCYGCEIPVRYLKNVRYVAFQGYPIHALCPHCREKLSAKEILRLFVKKSPFMRSLGSLFQLSDAKHMGEAILEIKKVYITPKLGEKSFADSIKELKNKIEYACLPGVENYEFAASCRDKIKDFEAQLAEKGDFAEAQLKELEEYAQKIIQMTERPPSARYWNQLI